jgi:xanthine dehydrogenase/oxidase
VAARTLKKPVRLSLERDVDIRTTGGRHPFVCKYAAAADKDGAFEMLDVRLYSNGR